MDFELTPQQALLQSTARAFLAERCTWDEVRALEKRAEGYSPELWRACADLGWMGLALPEADGGSGLSFLDWTLLVIEMGRVLLPGPYLTSGLAAMAVAAFGTAGQRAALLPAVARGERILAPAIYGRGLGWNRRGEGVTAARAGDGYTLEGLSLFVPWAAAADHLLVLARDDAGPIALLAETRQTGVQLKLLPTLAGDRQYEVRFAGARGAALGGAGAGSRFFEFLWARGALAAAAYLAGAAAALLDLTVDYAKNRVQFGQPIGAFQAIQHRCAEMKVDADGAFWVTLEAAWRLSEGQSGPDASIAKAYVSDALRRMITHGHQVHGAVGFSEEHPMTLFTRRVKQLEVQWGDATSHRAEVAAILLD